jgi:hypothetical protein
MVVRVNSAFAGHSGSSFQFGANSISKRKRCFERWAFKTGFNGVPSNFLYSYLCMNINVNVKKNLNNSMLYLCRSEMHNFLDVPNFPLQGNLSSSLRSFTILARRALR